MSGQKPRILMVEFHQETNTFNPLVASFDRFHPRKIFEGPECYEGRIEGGGMVAGFVSAITEAGGEVIPTVFMRAPSGGRVDDAVVEYLFKRLDDYFNTAGEIDGVVAALHGCTCAVGNDDVCGDLLEFLRDRVGDKVIAAAFDLHANITDKILKNTDIICGYNTYPHLDQYSTGYRAGRLCMERIAGHDRPMAAAAIPILISPSAFTDRSGPFKAVMETGRRMVDNGDILDFTVFVVQPWIDVSQITSRVITIGTDGEKAVHCANVLAQQLFDCREEMKAPLTSVDEILDIAEANTSGKPVILAESADSPNGGCVGDSPVVAMRLQARGSALRACMFIVDPEAVKRAFELGVGATAEFSVGAGFTKGMPGPFRAEGTVRSLHDGYFRTAPNSQYYLGPSAVVSFGNLDVLICNHGAASGSPMIFKSFGMEPGHYELVVVKANTSFRAPYAAISDLIYLADTPGAGASDLHLLPWENLPKELYPFDLPDGYTLTPAKLL